MRLPRGLCDSSCNADTLAHLVPRCGLHWTSYGTPGGAVYAELKGRFTDFGTFAGWNPQLDFISTLRLRRLGAPWVTRVRFAKPSRCSTGSGSLSRRVPWAPAIASWLLMLCGMVRFEHLQHSDIWISLEFSLASQKTREDETVWRMAPSSVAGFVRGTHGFVSAFVVSCP